MPTEAAISRTWLHRVNLEMAQASDTEHRSHLLYTIKESFLGEGTEWTDSGGSPATGPTSWAVIASSDSVTADASDNWADGTDVVWAVAPIAHSWCLLRHRHYFGTDDPLEILLDCSQASSATRGGCIGVYISRDGFDITTPLTTARPTATDEAEVLVENGAMTTAAWQGSDTNDEDHRTGRLHFQMNDDGRAVRIFICRLGACVAVWDLFRAEGWLETTWTIPALMMVASRDSDAELATWSNMQSATYVQYVSYDSNVGGQFRARMASVVSTGANTSVSTWGTCTLGAEGSSGLHAIDLQCLSPAAGYPCTLVDLWMGRIAIAGETYGDTNAKAQFGNWATPWNTSTPLLS